MSKVKAVPAGMHTVTPHLVIKGASKAIDFYKTAFGAQEVRRAAAADGRVMHAEIKIGNSIIFLADEFPEMGNKGPESGTSPVTLHIYVEDADKLFNRAVNGGASVRMPMMDAFWGDRYGQVIDPFGHSWALATHKEDVSEKEMERRAAAFKQQ